MHGKRSWPLPTKEALNPFSHAVVAVRSWYQRMQWKRSASTRQERNCIHSERTARCDYVDSIRQPERCLLLTTGRDHVLKKISQHQKHAKTKISSQALALTPKPCSRRKNGEKGGREDADLLRASLLLWPPQRDKGKRQTSPPLLLKQMKWKGGREDAGMLAQELERAPSMHPFVVVAAAYFIRTHFIKKLDWFSSKAYYGVKIFFAISAWTRSLYFVISEPKLLRY